MPVAYPHLPMARILRGMHRLRLQKPWANDLSDLHRRHFRTDRIGIRLACVCATEGRGISMARL
jgi:hypothetical protein